MPIHKSPKQLKLIEAWVASNLSIMKKPRSELLEEQQSYKDDVLKIYSEAFTQIIEKAVTFTKLLNKIKVAYDDSLEIRNQRISQFRTQDRVFGISANKKSFEEKTSKLIIDNEQLKEKNHQLHIQISKLEDEIGKIKDENQFDYLTLMKERDARYTLYFENVALQIKLDQLAPSGPPEDADCDPHIMRIALDRCREQLSETQRKLAHMSDEYAESVPQHEHEALERRYRDVTKTLDAVKADYEVLQVNYRRMQSLKRSTELELEEMHDRCRELESAGTPRPRWEQCADCISGGRDRWHQLSQGLTSREKLRILLKELGPAAETENLEYFDGLGCDPMIPPYLRHEGRVRNLRLSRREVRVLVTDIWRGKLQYRDIPMQDYVTKYFEDRYQQAGVRAEWAYNLCSSVEQLLDEAPLRLFWGTLQGHLSEDIYWGLLAEWSSLKEGLYKLSKDGETITLEEFEKMLKTTFPLKTEVDVRNLVEVARKQLKLRVNCNEVNLDKLLQENEEGFERLELARELCRQRQLAQDKYVREVIAELGGGRAAAGTKLVSVENLKRAFAIIDPAIDHFRMERNIRWAFSDKTSDLKNISPLPLRVLAIRLASGDIERMGPRYKGRVKRRNVVK